VAFDDINPTAPVHFLVIPRKPIAQLSKADAADEQVIELGYVSRDFSCMESDLLQVHCHVLEVHLHP
jgi:hypothetical protein